jgi:hypothetical protein
MPSVGSRRLKITPRTTNPSAVNPAAWVAVVKASSIGPTVAGRAAMKAGSAKQAA